MIAEDEREILERHRYTKGGNLLDMKQLKKRLRQIIWVEEKLKQRKELMKSKKRVSLRRNNW